MEEKIDVEIQASEEVETGRHLDKKGEEILAAGKNYQPQSCADQSWDCRQQRRPDCSALPEQWVVSLAGIADCRGLCQE